MFSHGNNLLFFFLLRVCPIFQISNVTGENLDLLKMFLNLLSIRAHFKKDEPSEFQIADTYSVPVGGSFVFILHRTAARSERTRVCTANVFRQAGLSLTHSIHVQICCAFDFKRKNENLDR